ncbi:Plug domain-containing protein [Bacteroides thetaiotaomicron]|nr:Plug domain-containing protein [Bacteroides thetaiotaomicron]
MQNKDRENREPDGSDLRIRGVATLGNQSPLVVVDGVPRDFSRIDPNMIEDITILKDATLP